jgi:hypothetical protein
MECPLRFCRQKACVNSVGFAELSEADYLRSEATDCRARAIESIPKERLRNALECGRIVVDRKEKIMYIGERHAAALEPTPLRAWQGHRSILSVQACTGIRIGARDLLNDEICCLYDFFW